MSSMRCANLCGYAKAIPNGYGPGGGGKTTPVALVRSVKFSRKFFQIRQILMHSATAQYLYLSVN